MLPFRHVLAPTDFSAPAARALESAVELAQHFGANLTLVHAYEIPGILYTGAWGDFVTPIEQAARAELDGLLASVRSKVPAARAELRCGLAWSQILDVGRELRADVLVIGTHGRTGLGHVLLGSVAERVVQHADIPVLTVRSPKLPNATP